MNGLMKSLGEVCCMLLVNCIPNFKFKQSFAWNESKSNLYELEEGNCQNCLLVQSHDARTKGVGRKISRGATEKRPKNSSIKPISTISVPREITAPPDPDADAHGTHVYFTA